MKTLTLALVVLAALAAATSADAAGWTTTVPKTNVVASSPTPGWGYPAADGVPVPGECGAGSFNSNRSESWIAVKPGTEDAVGTSKFFFDKYSTFYNFYLGAYTITDGAVAGNAGIPGYDCVTTASQEMPPSWTNNTDPNVDFDTQGRAYSVSLPFNAYWTNLHPNGAISGDYSDDLGQTWHRSKGADKFGYIEFLNNQTSLATGGFEDKQWVAVNHSPLTKYQDHAYAMWAIFNGQGIKLRLAVSRDRGLTYSMPVTITSPSDTGPSNFGVYPSVDAAGDLYVAFASYRVKTGGFDGTIYVTRSTDDGATFAPWTKVAFAHGYPGDFVNGDFRDGILQNFTASTTYPGHAYVTFEDYNAATGTMDVKFAYTTDGGFTFSTPVTVNDAATVADSTDQFQPSVAAGPNGAVAVAFYDRRATCPNDRSVAPENVGDANTCIDVSLQAYKDDGTVVTAVGTNARMTDYAWDPSEPRQHVDGIGQIACYRHRDPCDGVFIGDYFGLAVSGGNIYGLFVSTHYPSAVRADEGGKVYYQQAILATVPRSGFGSGY
ncbi:MAG TPA: sialidase family protein [Gaiellaceae bacterium]|nr:sialidase family protein [Gaiellaceae bacterium]